MSGISLNVKSSFRRVLKDLSFIPYVRPDNMRYLGVYRSNNTETSANTAPGDKYASYRVGAVTYTDNSIIVGSGTGAGVTAGVKIECRPATGIMAQTISAVFKSVRLPALTNYNFWPVASMWADSASGSERQHPCAFSIGVYTNSAGDKKLSMRSGNLTQNEFNADIASIPFDFTSSTPVSVSATRDETGHAIMTAIISGQVFTVEYDFPAVVLPDDSKNARFWFGSISSRTLKNVELVTGSVWDVALTRDELQRANYRQNMVYGM